jgi:hypothetical protein
VLNIEIHNAGSHFHWTFRYQMLNELPLLFRYVNKHTITSSKLIIIQNVTIIRSLCADLFFCNKQNFTGYSTTLLSSFNVNLSFDHIKEIFKFLTAILVNIFVSWDMTPCILLKTFGGAYYIHLQGNFLRLRRLLPSSQDKFLELPWR